MKMKRFGAKFKIPLPPKPVGEDEDPDLEVDTEAEEKVRKVEEGPELLRIMGLESRPIADPDSAEAEALAQLLTDRFRLHDGDLFPGNLRPIQALALKEAWDAQGGFFPIGVGHGKMLLAYLLMTLFNRPTAYICKGDGKKDAEGYFAQYRKHWKSLPTYKYKIWTYELLSNPASAPQQTLTGHVIPGRLERFKPKLVIADECHMMGSTASAVWRRMKDYLTENPDVIFIVMTGTPFKTSLNDCAHLMQYSLKGRCPVPTNFKERMAWAGAVDAKPGLFGRVEPGALMLLARKMMDEPNLWTLGLEGARKSIGLRILRTPGVIGTQEPPVAIPLTIQELVPDEECPELVEVFENLRKTWALPDGTQIADPKQMARHEKTISLGYWMRYVDPGPSQEWKDARNLWAKYCRRALKNNKRKVYSEALLKAEISKGHFKSGAEILHRWQEEEAMERKRTGQREPPTECVWISSEMLDTVAEWISEYKGLVWVEHIGLGEKLRDHFGIPYYGAGGGLDEKSGTNIRSHKGGAAIASFKACSVGKNLQGFWSDNLWLGATPTEQAMARTHRPGQKASVVRNWVYLGCARHLEGFEMARSTKATFCSQITLSDQKLNFAHVHMPSLLELSARPGIRWSSKKLLDDQEDFA